VLALLSSCHCLGQLPKPKSPTEGNNVRFKHSTSMVNGACARGAEDQRGKISFSADSILSISSRITLIDCWFFEG
jgi:hypothetical protein